MIFVMFICALLLFLVIDDLTAPTLEDKMRETDLQPQPGELYARALARSYRELEERVWQRYLASLAKQ